MAGPLRARGGTAVLTRVMAVIAVFCAAMIMSPPPAQGSGDCPDGTTKVGAPDGGSSICVVVTDPGTPDDTGDSEDSGTSSSGSKACQRVDGTPVDCVTDYGVWDSSHQCWVHPVHVPQTDPVWEDRTDGSIWMCGLITDGVDPVVMFWVPPGSGPGALPDPGELAQEAVGLLPLETAEVRTAPQNPARSYVGVENWLWVPESQWAILTETVTAGDTSVTVTAEPDRVLWDMGPGAKSCYDPGRVWESGMTDEAATTCGYTYVVTSQSAPDGAFALAATIRYQVDWVCTGACTSSTGTLGLVDAPAGTGALRVLQRQTVVVQ